MKVCTGGQFASLIAGRDPIRSLVCKEYLGTSFTREVEKTPGETTGQLQGVLIAARCDCFGLFAETKCLESIGYYIEDVRMYCYARIFA